MADPAKIPLIGGASKPKKPEKSYWFELTLQESNDETYPEFSWSELVAERKAEEAKDKISSGRTVLDPYASDDDDDLKAMAARLEEKYGNAPTKKAKSSKRKRLAEDYIDRGAGYDESDSFIDNSDVYDEIVPADLETVRGGFYINSGSLDFREVEISDEEDPPDDEQGATKNGKINKESSKQSKQRPSVVVSKKQGVVSGKVKQPKMDGAKTKNTSKPVPVAVGKPEAATKTTKKSTSDAESSSSGSSSSSSSSDDSSSSSDSSSSGEEEPEEEQSKKVVKEVPKKSLTNSVDTDAPRPPKRLKTKNVPPNPHLAKHKLLSSSPTGLLNSSKEIIVTSTPNTSGSKASHRPGQSISPITAVSSLGIPLPHGITASNIKVPTPKTTPTGASTSNSSALNLVRQSNKVTKPKQQRQNSKKMNLYFPPEALKMVEAAAKDPQLAGLAQNLALAQSLAASAQGVHPKMKAKAKAKSLIQASKNLTQTSSKQSSPQQQHQPQPPKLKAKAKMSTSMPPSSLQLSGSLSQSMPSFSRIAQPPSMNTPAVEITKIKPSHATSSPSSSASQHLNPSIKSLSNLGSGITVTEVKESKSGGSSSQHLSASGATSVITVTSASSNNHNRSRSPNVNNNSGSSHAASRQSLTITPSSLLNLSASGSHTSSTSTAASIALANLNMMPPVSRSNPYGHQSGSSVSKKSNLPFNVNNILSQNDFGSTSSSSANNSSKADYYPGLHLTDAVTMATYNSYFANTQKK